MKLFVYHTPEATPTDHLPDCAVVIDVLRATTTIATALHAGAEAVQTFANLTELFEVSESWDPALRLRAGERGGKMVEGCDLGNSPLICTPEMVAGKRLFLTTTNGTRALKRVEQSPIVVTASLANRQTVLDFLKQEQPETVWFVGSGWEGDYSLEDTVCAGAIAHELWDGLAASIGNDEVVGAIALYQQWREDLFSLLKLASHGQRLLRLDNEIDIRYCAAVDRLDVLPIQKEAGLLIAHHS